MPAPNPALWLDESISASKARYAARLAESAASDAPAAWFDKLYAADQATQVLSTMTMATTSENINDRIKLVGRTDQGAFDRAIKVAYALRSAGRWDGQSDLWIDGYIIHSAVFGLDQTPLEGLLLVRRADGFAVVLPVSDAEALAALGSTSTSPTPANLTAAKFFMQDARNAWAQRI